MFMKSISVNKIVKMILESHYRNVSLYKKMLEKIFLVRKLNFYAPSAISTFRHLLNASFR